MPPAGAEVEQANFDMLRVNIELNVPTSAVVAITSATAEDGKELAARGLAYALSMCGYATLFIDTALANRTLASLPRGLGIEEIGRRQSPPTAGDGKLAVLTLNDITLQQTTSLRGMKAALDILRSKFDYVVISTDVGVSSAFGTVVAASADAILVSVATRRRRTDGDVKLASALDSFGSRFLGIVAMNPRIIASNATAPVPVTTTAPVPLAATACVPSAAVPVRRRRTAWVSHLARAWHRRATASPVVEGDADESGATSAPQELSASLG